MIKSEDFTAEELEAMILNLEDIKNEEKLKGAVLEIFKEYDDDNNEYLDRKELRLFLTSLFEKFKIRFPLTDEAVDAVFVQMDSNRDNKIQPDELQSYALKFAGDILPMYQKALNDKKAAA
jgi:Ca2+-binding EF-hand superfamily protein